MVQVKPNTSLLYSFNGTDGELILSLNPQTRFMASFDNNTVKLNGHNMDKNVPGDELVYNDLADEILAHTPEQGYLTISNALQWRLQYARVIALNNQVSGVLNYEW